MQDNGFWEFAILYELLFPDDEDREIQCSSCGRVIKGNEEVGWVDEKKNILKCPRVWRRFKD